MLGPNHLQRGRMAWFGLRDVDYAEREHIKTSPGALAISMQDIPSMLPQPFFKRIQIAFIGMQGIITEAILRPQGINELCDRLTRLLR